MFFLTNKVHEQRLTISIFNLVAKWMPDGHYTEKNVMVWSFSSKCMIKNGIILNTWWAIIGRANQTSCHGPLSDTHSSLCMKHKTKIKIEKALIKNQIATHVCLKKKASSVCLVLLFFLTFRSTIYFISHYGDSEQDTEWEIHLHPLNTYFHLKKKKRNRMK